MLQHTNKNPIWYATAFDLVCYSTRFGMLQHSQRYATAFNFRKNRSSRRALQADRRGVSSATNVIERYERYRTAICPIFTSHFHTKNAAPGG